MITGWNSDPVLLTGRGGSGTRMLSHIAIDARIFLGNRLNKSLDSEEWVDLIYGLVQSYPDALELPEGSRHAAAIRTAASEILSAAAEPKSPVWGLKLPELMLTLPFFTDAFKEARVIHLLRHPVSACVRRSHMTSRLGNPVGDVVLPLSYRFAGRPLEAIKDDEVHLHNAFSWQFQVSRIMNWGRSVLGSERYLEVKLEDLMNDSDRVLQQITSFCNITEPASSSLDVDHDRIQPVDMSTDEAREVWQICGETARQLGYSEK